MIRILFFILLVFALGYGFSLLADMPGSVSITVAGKLITLDLITAVAMMLAVLVAIMVTWWILRAVWTSPMRAKRFFRARKRDRGYEALSSGIIAAGAGDPTSARKMLNLAHAKLAEDKEPLLQLLDAQATMLEGDHEKARGQFEAMLDDPKTRSLALRGLYMEAQRLEDREAQKHYAEKAAELAPELAWAGRAAVSLKTASGDWEGALRLVDGQKSRNQISKDDANRKRAVLLTAMAMELVEGEPARAKSAALEAHKLAPEFAPAAVVCAEAAQRLNDMRKAVKVLETCWRKQPHPEVALAYVNARPGDSALDRLKRAQKLEALKPNTIESSMIVARMALEAGEFEQARAAVAAVLRNQPRESAYMLMADIEDAETGDQGKMREWLARAVRAPRDPAWTADGYVSQRWAPFSPVTGEIDAFEWKVPVERLGGPLLENDLDPMEPGRSPAMDAEAIVAASTISATAARAKAAPADDVIDAEPVTDADPKDTIVQEVKQVAEGTSETFEQTVETVAETVAGSAPQPDQQPEQKAAGNVSAQASDEPASTDAPGKDSETEMITVTPRMPDDPGIGDDEEASDKPSRFRLF